MLDIHDYNGQLAVEAAGLMEEFGGLVLEGRQAMWILEPNGNVVFEKADDVMGGRPEVQRGDLRQLLLDSLPEGIVRWGCKVGGVRALGDGRHEVSFVGGGTVTASVLVGADGAWSRVRPLLTTATPEYSGSSLVEMYLFEADTRHPAAARVVGGGSLMVPASGNEIHAHREKGDTLHTYVVLDRPLDWFDAIDFTDVAAATGRLAREFDGWAPELTALITESDTAPVLRPLYALPVGLRWDRVPGVTLLGDAAHHAIANGEGANLAMLDGAELGKALAAHPGDLEAALAEYESAMFTRTTETLTGTGILMESLFGGDAPEQLADMFTAQQQPS